MGHEIKWLQMSKKHKNKSTNSSGATSTSSRDEDHICDPEEPVRTCIRLDIKPLSAPSKRSSTSSSSSSASSKDRYIANDVFHKEAFLNAYDAHKVDIRDGECALIVKLNQEDDCHGEREDFDISSDIDAAICKIRVTGTTSDVSASSRGGGTPLKSKKNSGNSGGSGAISVSCGELRLSSECFAAIFGHTNAETICTNVGSSATQQTQRGVQVQHQSRYTSPAKAKFSFANGGGGKNLISPQTAIASPPPPSSSAAKFSFAKGGGGDALISPRQYVDSPSVSASSASKFSFAKGGGGDALYVSPSCNSANRGRKSGNESCIQSSPEYGRRKPLSMIGLLVPLTNLSHLHLRMICHDAHRLVLCPTSSGVLSNVQSTNSSRLASSDLIQNAPTHLNINKASLVLQSLIIAKYQGMYIQPPRKERIRRNDLQQLEIISVSFRGKLVSFYIVDVSTGHNGVEEPKCNDINNDDEGILSERFCNLTLSPNERSDNEQDYDDVKCESELLLRKALKDKFEQNRQDDTAEIESESKCLSFKITSQTEISFVSSLDRTSSIEKFTNLTAEANDVWLGSDRQPTRNYCAGLDATLSRVKDILLPPLLQPELFPKDGVLRPPKGALLFGPPGVGKTLLASQIADEMAVIRSSFQGGKSVFVRSVQCADILASTAVVGEAEKLLTSIFEDAEWNATMNGLGSLLILDDVHLICPRRGAFGAIGGVGVEQLAGTLLALLDGIGNPNSAKNTSAGVSKPRGGLVVLAVTTDPSILDPALRRPGRLDCEVEVPVPDDKTREEIIRFHLTQIADGLGANSPLSEKEVENLARLAKGFTGADIKLAIKEAFRHSLRSSNSSTIQYADLDHAIRITKPSAIKSVAVEVPHVPWSAIGGMENIKSLLKESIELPLSQPHLFEMMQIPPPRGVLLYGPPGCSKTLMARAIATEFNMNFLAVKGPELLSKWLGESERALASLFRRARLASPSVIFFDEIDAIASKRGGNGAGGGGGDRLLSQLLTELDGVISGGGGISNAGPALGRNGARVVVVGATNRPDTLDSALTRPGRMDRMIYVGLPNEEGRKSIFEIGLRGKTCSDDVDVSNYSLPISIF
ncbi:hypothetical protein ACHAXS_010108 [Conticribra weissflogii]